LKRRYLFAGLLSFPLLGFIGRRPMPSFKGKTLKGESFSNESLKNKPVLIQFWATWCGYCRRDQPAVERIIHESPDLVVLAVSVGESRQKVRKYLEDSPRTAKIVINEDTNLPALFEIKSFPTYVLVDSKGGIVDMQEGSGGYEALQNLVGKI
jgi:thiol-disulfide isomerase/thioredoxin